MLEILCLLTFSGFVLSSKPRYGLGNPFQIYFFVWFLVFFAYLLTKSSWITPAPEFLFLLLVISLFWFTLFIYFEPYIVITQASPQFANIEINGKLVHIFQTLSILALPLLYLKAMELSGGHSIFTVLGFILLRTSMTEDMMGYGLLSYFGVLSMVTSSVSIFLFSNKEIKISRLIISILVSLAYMYLFTGRTFLLLFFTLHLVPLVLTKKIGVKGLLFCSLLLCISFVIVAAMSAKGISLNRDLYDNIFSFTENIRGYTVAPLLAFSTIFDNPSQQMMGENTFRTVLNVLDALGFSGMNSPSLIRNYAFVPDATNVYTVYEVYFRDFGGFGFAFLIPIALLHIYLFRRAAMSGGVYVFWYSASTYPLIMQFFQDQYFSLLSMWVQIFFWYWVVMKGTFFYRMFHDA